MPVFADAFRSLRSPAPRISAASLAARARLLEGELGVAVDVLVERFDVGILGIEAAIDDSTRAGDVGGNRPPAAKRGRKGRKLRSSGESPSWSMCVFPPLDGPPSAIRLNLTKNVETWGELSPMFGGPRALEIIPSFFQEVPRRAARNRNAHAAARPNPTSQPLTSA